MVRIQKIESGPLALIRALFNRAWLDIAASNGHAEDARRFLRDPGTIARLADWGIEPDWYYRLLDGEDQDADEELDQRIVALDEWGMDRTGIALELWGDYGSSRLTRISEVLGVAKQYGKVGRENGNVAIKNRGPHPDG